MKDLVINGSKAKLENILTAGFTASLHETAARDPRLGHVRTAAAANQIITVEQVFRVLVCTVVVVK